MKHYILNSNMGQCLSPPDDVNYRLIYSEKESIGKWKAQFDALCLEQYDVGKLYKIFRKVDKDDSGTIEILELLMYLDLERSPFTKRIFCILDEDNSGAIDFREFVLSLWNYCTLSKATLVLFAFDLYDKDSSGVLDVEEVQQMLKDVYGKSYQSNGNAKRVFSKIEELKTVDGLIDIDTFRKFTSKQQALLYPAFEVQLKMQNKVLGSEFWQHLSERRIEVSRGEYLSLGNFMQLHVNKEMYGNIMVAPRKQLNNRALSIFKQTGSIAKRSGTDTSMGLPPLPTESSKRNGRKKRIDINLARVVLAHKELLTHNPDIESPDQMTDDSSAVASLDKNTSTKAPVELSIKHMPTDDSLNSQEYSTLISEKKVVKDEKEPIECQLPATSKLIRRKSVATISQTRNNGDYDASVGLIGGSKVISNIDRAILSDTSAADAGRTNAGLRRAIRRGSVVY